MKTRQIAPRFVWAITALSLMIVGNLRAEETLSCEDRRTSLVLEMKTTLDALASDVKFDYSSSTLSIQRDSYELRECGSDFLTSPSLAAELLADRKTLNTKQLYYLEFQFHSLKHLAALPDAEWFRVLAFNGSFINEDGLTLEGFDKIAYIIRHTGIRWSRASDTDLAKHVSRILDTVSTTTGHSIRNALFLSFQAEFGLNGVSREKAFKYIDAIYNQFDQLPDKHNYNNLNRLWILNAGPLMPRSFRERMEDLSVVTALGEIAQKERHRFYLFEHIPTGLVSLDSLGIVTEIDSDKPISPDSLSGMGTGEVLGYLSQAGFNVNRDDVTTGVSVVDWDLDHSLAWGLNLKLNDIKQDKLTLAEAILILSEKCGMVVSEDSPLLSNIPPDLIVWSSQGAIPTGRDLLLGILQHCAPNCYLATEFNVEDREEWKNQLSSKALLKWSLGIVQTDVADN